MGGARVWTPKLLSVRGPAFWFRTHDDLWGDPRREYVRAAARSMRADQQGLATVTCRSWSRDDHQGWAFRNARWFSHAARNASSPSSRRMWWDWRVSLRATERVARFAPALAATVV